MTHWAYSFYDVQDRLTGCYAAPVHPFHFEKAAEVRRTVPGLRLLELGSGGGQFAVAAALEGLSVTTLEYREAGNAHAQALAAQHGVTLRTITGDFYVADPGGPFDVICVWDGFGIGSDEEQRILLRRFPGWLAPGGHALVEIYTPGYWHRHAGFTRRTPAYVQTYGYDPGGERMTDSYAANGETWTQSLRCYAPADLRLVLAGTGLTLTHGRTLRPGRGRVVPAGDPGRVHDLDSDPAARCRRREMTRHSPSDLQFQTTLEGVTAAQLGGVRARPHPRRAGRRLRQRHQ